MFETLPSDVFYSFLFPGKKFFNVLVMSCLLGLSSALHTNQTFIQSVVAGTVMGLIACLHSVFGTGLAMGQVISYLWLDKCGWYVFYNLVGFLAGFFTMLCEGDHILVETYIGLKQKYRLHKYD